MTRGTPSTNRITEIPVPAATLLALVVSLLTCAVLYYLNTIFRITETTLALIFLLPVGISSSYWGLIPGTTAAIFSFLSFNFFFIPEIFSFQVKKSEDLVVLVAFLLIAMFISEFTGRIRRNLATSSERENEALRLYEFITTLSGIQSEQTASRIIVEKFDQIFQPFRIEILIETAKYPIIYSKGSSRSDPWSPKPYVYPLQSTRELTGEIRIWPRKSFSENEERLLRIFANQSVLTIERMRYAEESRRIKVLEESDALKTSLLSSVSHELRSPLAAIKASVSSLRTEEVPWESEARGELLTMVEEEIDHLNMLVGNLLDMSRIEAGVLRPQKKPNLLGEIIAAVTGRMRPQFQLYKVAINIPEDLPLINMDYVQMQQVITNLLTNSLKYSPEGSTITISANLLPENDQVAIVIANQSMPIPNDDLDRIFEKFYRINPSERITGSGLGLSICKGIIEAHGGRIWAENVANGLAFKLIIPLI
jgi:two-component system sensor histidine kinase KdpD